MASRIVGEYPGCFLGEHPPRICKGKKAFGVNDSDSFR